MVKKERGAKDKCPTCHKSTGRSGHMCFPHADTEERCDWCDALILNQRHLCQQKVKEITYICNSCGRTAIKAEFLCKPKKIQ